jgi:hypothetical protein
MISIPTKNINEIYISIDAGGGGSMSPPSFGK